MNHELAPLDPLAQIVGERIASELTPRQRELVTDAIAQNPAGVARLAQATTQPSVTNPIGAFLTWIRNGKHTQPDPPAKTTPPGALTQLDFAERRYNAKRATSADHATALTYATDTTLTDYRGEQTYSDTRSFDAALEHRLGLRPSAEPDAVCGPQPDWRTKLAALANRQNINQKKPPRAPLGPVLEPTDEDPAFLTFLQNLEKRAAV